MRSKADVACEYESVVAFPHLVEWVGASLRMAGKGPTLPVPGQVNLTELSQSQEGTKNHEKWRFSSCFFVAISSEQWRVPELRRFAPGSGLQCCYWLLNMFP